MIGPSRYSFEVATGTAWDETEAGQSAQSDIEPQNGFEYGRFQFAMSHRQKYQQAQKVCLQRDHI